MKRCTNTFFKILPDLYRLVSVGGRRLWDSTKRELIIQSQINPELLFLEKW